jgi:hypothetical protein
MAPDKGARIVELEREIRELGASLPAHSVPPSMLIRLEELEDELEALRTEFQDTEEGAG